MFRFKLEVVKQLDEFRKDGQYCDVSIQVEERLFRCHRVILAAACEYFHSMFNGNFRESSSQNIVLGGNLSSVAFEQVLHCLYTSEIEITDENVYHLLVLSDFLKINYIEESCSRHIINHPSKRNALEIFIYACATDKKPLIGILAPYIMINLEQISKSSQFLKISFDDFCILLKQNVPSRNENVLAHTLIRWVLYAREERLFCIDELTNIIRFQHLSPGYTEFIFKRYIMDCAASSNTRTDDTLQIDSSSFELSNKLSLHIYVEYVHKREENPVTTIFSRNNRTKNWRSPFILEPGAFFLRNIESDNREYLYSLNFRRSQEQTFRVYSPVDRADRNFSTSTLLKNPPTVLPEFDMTRMRDKIYVMNDTKRDGISPVTYTYECNIDEWFTIPQPNKMYPKSCMASDENASLIYLIGGYRGCVQTYDPRMSRWQNAVSTNFQYYDAACCFHDGRIYVCGGNKFPTKVEVLDPVAGKWKVMEPMIKGRSRHRLLFFEDRLCVMGNNYPEYTIDSYDPLFHQWTTITLPNDILTKGNPDRKNLEASIIQDAVVCKNYE